MLLIQLSQAIPSIWWGIKLWVLCSESHNPATFSTWWEDIFSPGCVPPNDTVNSESEVGVKFGDSGVVIGCQVDELLLISRLLHCQITHLPQFHRHGVDTSRLST